jgi:hypothetical protein
MTSRFEYDKNVGTKQYYYLSYLFFHIVLGKLLAALLNGLTDRNAVIRKNYAISIGHLVSTAKDSSLEKLFAKIKTWYFEKEGNKN